MKKYARATAWLIVAGFVLQIAASVAAGHYLLGLSMSPFVVLAILALTVFIGTRLRALNNIVHECSHATFSCVRPDNAVIGKICSSLALGCFVNYRDEHLSHHAHLGCYEHDLDLQGIKDLRLHEPLSRSVILRHLSNPLLGRHLRSYLKIDMSARDGRKYQVLKAGVILSTLLFTAFLPLTGLIFLIVPFTLIFTTLNYWADCLDHAGLISSEDDLEASRNIVAPRLVRWLFFPRNDCFHLVHHLFPHIPARHLEMSHYILAEDRTYRSRPNAVRSPEKGRTDYPGVIAAE